MCMIKVVKIAFNFQPIFFYKFKVLPNEVGNYEQSNNHIDFTKSRRAMKWKKSDFSTYLFIIITILLSSNFILDGLRREEQMITIAYKSFIIFHSTIKNNVNPAKFEMIHVLNIILVKN